MANIDASTVNYNQGGTGAVVRAVDKRLQDSVSVKDFGAKGDSTTVDQTSIQRAVDFAISSNSSLYWPAGEYVSSANISNFWQVSHYGAGKILREGQVFHITPVKDQLNIIHVAEGRSVYNDGLSPRFAATMESMNNIIRDLGCKAEDGQWRVSLAAGTITSYRGIRLNDWPVFRNQLQFWGQEATDVQSITSIWDGTNHKTASAYAILAQNTSNTLYIDFRYIKFQNWNNDSANSGAIVLWEQCRVLVDKCAFINCPMGISCRYGYMRVINSHFEDNSTVGAGIAYTGTGNVGALTSGTNTFLRSGVDVGRASICYVQNNDFYECDTCVSVSRVSRARTQNNRFHSWNRSVFNFALGSVYTPDNNAGYPDEFIQTPTISAPVWKSSTNSAHLHFQRGGTRGRHVTSTGILINIQDKTGTQILLSSEANDPTWVPFRLPGYTLYGDNWKLEAEFGLQLAAGAGGRFSLNGQGPGAAAELAAFSIAPVASYTRAVVKISIIPTNTSSGSVARATIEIPAMGIYLNTTASINSSYFRTASESLMLFRCYWTPNSNAQATFFNLLTYVEA